MKHRANCVYVAARAHLRKIAAELLGWGKYGSAHECSRLRESRVGRVVRPPRQAKVQHARLARGVNQHVRRFQIAVNHAALVRVADRIAKNPEHLHDMGDGSRLFTGRPSPAIERLSLDPLQCNDELSVDFLDAVDFDDIGVIERGGGLDLAFEARPHRRCGENAGRKPLQRHLAIRPLLAGAINQSLSAATGFGDQFESPDPTQPSRADTLA